VTHLSNIRTILLDIEGTTTHLDFVYKVLFPFARAHVRQFLAEYAESGDGRECLNLLQLQHEADQRQGLVPPPAEWRPPKLDAVVQYVNWLMDRDSKDRGLKLLQGKIWEHGYASGELQSHVFSDVPVALQRWRNQQKEICIFSSGSVLAQQQLFANTVAGDLTGFIAHYFDTSVGGKREPLSYTKIADVLKSKPQEIVFLSDVSEELDAAQQAGMETVLCVRPGNRPQSNIDRYRTASTLDRVCPD
jgi:enolase-phosphatase E1